DVEECARDGREAAAVPAEAREVERRQHGVAPRAVAERRRPGVLASVEVDRDDAAEGRLEERQTPGAEEPLEAPDVAMRDGTAGRRLAQRQHVRLGYRGHVEPPGRRIGGGAGQPAPAPTPGTATGPRPPGGASRGPRSYRSRSAGR